MTSVPRLLDLIVRKFETRARLDDEDRAALRRLPYSERTIEAGRYIAREGDRTEVATLLVDGLAFRHKVTAEGSRQILSVHVPGDFVDLENCLLKVADHSVQALTMCNVAVIPETAIIELIDSHPRVGRAMWVDTLIDGSIFREWIVNVGRRDARAGMCHLLCEFARRLELAGLGSPDGYEMPMSQEQLADALGLTPVHVHRVLKELDREGLIRREKRHVLIPDWSALRKVAGFNELYLHLDQAAFPHATPRGVDRRPAGAGPARPLG